MEVRQFVPSRRARIVARGKYGDIDVFIRHRDGLACPPPGTTRPPNAQDKGRIGNGVSSEYPGVISRRRILYWLAVMVAVLVVGTIIGFIWADAGNRRGFHRGGVQHSRTPSASSFAWLRSASTPAASGERGERLARRAARRRHAKAHSNVPDLRLADIKIVESPAAPSERLRQAGRSNSARRVGARTLPPNVADHRHPRLRRRPSFRHDESSCNPAAIPTFFAPG